MAEVAKTMSMRRLARGGTPVSRAAVVALPLLLGGCGVWDEFFGEEPQPTRVEVPAESAQAQTPSFGSIPERRATSPEAQRRALQQGLQADREGASYYQGPGQAPSPSGVPTSDSGAATAGQMQPPPAGSDAPPPPPTRPRAGFDEQQPAAAPQMSAVPQFQAQFQQQAPLRRELVGVIYFAHGSANLDGRDREVLRQIRSMLEGTGGQLRVIGHASMRTGVMEPARHAMANFEISQQRAAAVANELNRLGVPDAALVIDAVGAQQPVFYEFMPTGEAGNRRVEIYLEY